MTEPYDIAIPLHPKDHTKLPFLIHASFAYTDAGTIHIMAYAPEEARALVDKACEDCRADPTRIVVHDERDILPESRDIFPEPRRGWLFQQFLTLFQDVTKAEWYIGLNADLIFLQAYPVFTQDGRPFQVLARDMNSQREIYNPFNKEMFGHHTEIAPYNYLSDASLYNKKLTRDMADTCGGKAEFMRRSAEIIKTFGHVPGDANLYMHYIWNTHRTLYTPIVVKNLLNGRYNSGEWQAAEIEKFINSAENDAATLSVHSWT